MNVCSHKYFSTSTPLSQTNEKGFDVFYLVTVMPIFNNLPMKLKTIGVDNIS